MNNSKEKQNKNKKTLEGETVDVSDQRSRSLISVLKKLNHDWISSFTQ